MLVKGDKAAVDAACKAITDQYKALQLKSQADEKAWKVTLSIDEQTIKGDADGTDKMRQDRAKFEADKAAAKAAQAANAAALKNFSTNDPTLAAAKAKLAADSKMLTDDQARLNADMAKLTVDIKAAFAKLGHTGGDDHGTHTADGTSGATTVHK